ncbi:MAG: hypothetical protein RR612_11735 [Oscillospiraceae bacterium]
MKQYCRYCANANLVDDDICYCDIKKGLRTKAVCTVANKCKAFVLNEIDVFDFDKTYKPRAEQPPNEWEQIKL